MTICIRQWLGWKLCRLNLHKRRYFWVTIDPRARYLDRVETRCGRCDTELP